MISRRNIEELFTRELVHCLPHLSVDCVVFGFHNEDLKLLLHKWKHLNRWSLPAGYIRRRESLDAAAERILRERTGLRRILLKQFHTFGDLNRKESMLRELYTTLGIDVPRDAWTIHRVISIGYYALVDFRKVRPKVDYVSDACSWHPIHDRPALAFDHDKIVELALAALQQSLHSPTAGATLLPERFTMSELRHLHEAILGRSLDRRNFQKRMLERGGLNRLPERRTGGAYRAPFLYRFAPRRPTSGS
jgi:ADP-ribose pyrophosphatase YjhB (NUDIX family)